MAPLLASSHSQRVADLLHHEPSLKLRERQAMPQTLEPGIKSEHSKGKRTGGDGAQTTNAEQRSFGYRRARKQVGYGIAIQRAVG